MSKVSYGLRRVKNISSGDFFFLYKFGQPPTRQSSGCYPAVLSFPGLSFILLQSPGLKRLLGEMSISFDSVVEDIYGTGLLKGLHLILDDRAITGSSVLYSLCSHFKQHSSEDARVINADLSYDRRRLTLKLKEMFKGQIQVFNMAPDVGNMRDHKIATHYSEKFKALICTIKKHNGADLLVIVNGLEEALLGAPQSLILNHLCSLRGVVDEVRGSER